MLTTSCIYVRHERTLRLHQKQVLTVHRFSNLKAHGPKQFRPVRSRRQVIVAYCTSHLVVKGVQLRASDEVENQKLTTRF